MWCVACYSYPLFVFNARMWYVGFSIISHLLSHNVVWKKHIICTLAMAWLPHCFFLFFDAPPGSNMVTGRRPKTYFKIHINFMFTNCGCAHCMKAHLCANEKVRYRILINIQQQKKAATGQPNGHTNEGKMYREGIH